jgi:hypothetical protein
MSLEPPKNGENAKTLAAQRVTGQTRLFSLFPPPRPRDLLSPCIAPWISISIYYSDTFLIPSDRFWAFFLWYLSSLVAAVPSEAVVATRLLCSRLPAIR